MLHGSNWTFVWHTDYPEAVEVINGPMAMTVYGIVWSYVFA